MNTRQKLEWISALKNYEGEWCTGQVQFEDRVDCVGALARFKEMVGVAIKEFNAGSLGRSVTMLDLAERMTTNAVRKRRADSRIMGVRSGLNWSRANVRSRLLTR